MISELPRYQRSQKGGKDPSIQAKLCSKLQLVYVKRGPVKSLTSYFMVPKGDGDVWVVYDATKSGLNQCLWVPLFYLPSVESMIRAMDSDSWMGD
jgi:hypothetical protein